MLIRTEIGSDIPRITSFIRDELHQPKIEKRVEQIREQGLISLSMLALNDDGYLVGYIICSPVLLDGKDSGWLTISALLTNQGDIYSELGQSLAKEAIDSLYEFGYNAVVLFENDYPNIREGFILSSTLSLQGLPNTKVWVSPLYDEDAANHSAEITLSYPLHATMLTSTSVVD